MHLLWPTLHLWHMHGCDKSKLQIAYRYMQRSDTMYGVLLADERVVALAQPRAHALHAHDMLLLASFVLGSDSFRAAAESFSPICLPRFNPAAFLHAYVRFLDEVRS